MPSYIDVLQMWRSYAYDTAEQLDGILRDFRIAFAHHSGWLDNSDVRERHTRSIFETSTVFGFSGDPRALFEQMNQRLCYEYLKPRIVRREPLTVDLVREVHRTLLGGVYDNHRYIDQGERPGAWKRCMYITRKGTGVQPGDVDGAMRELIDDVSAYDGVKTLRAATYLHAQFAWIQPFADGNGRVARTLTNYHLMTHGYPPLIVFADDMRQYQDALLAYDEWEDIMPLHRLFEHETEKTWATACAAWRAGGST